MFIQVNERPLNVYSIMYYYLRDTEEAFMIYYRLTDGRILEESFATDADRAVKVEELGNATLGGLVQEDTYNDFPETGSKGAIYLAKDTGQMWFWDETLENYEKIGVSRKGGIYQYNKDLDKTIGATTDIAKSELAVIVEPSVPFMDGSEVTAHNAVRGIITNSTNTHVTVRTVADMVIDSFIQVNSEDDLPAKGELNVLYYIKDLDVFTTWTGTAYDLKAITLVITPNNINSSDTYNKLSHAYKSYLNHEPYHVFYRNKIANTNNSNSNVQTTYYDITVPMYFIPSGLLNTTLVDMRSPLFYFPDRPNTQNQIIRAYSYGFRCSLTDKGSTQIKGITATTDSSMSVAQGDASNAGLLLRMDNAKAYTPTSDYHPATKKYVDDTASQLKAYAEEEDIQVKEDLTTEVESLPQDISPVDVTTTTYTNIYKDALDKVLEDKKVTRPYSDALAFITNPANQELYGKYYLTCSYGTSDWTNSVELAFMSNDPDMFSVGSGVFRFYAEYDENKPVYLVSMKSGVCYAELITARESFEPYYSSLNFSLAAIVNDNIQIHTNANLRLTTTSAFNLYDTQGGTKLRTVAGGTPIIRAIAGKLYTLPTSGSYMGLKVGTTFYCNNALYKVVANDASGTRYTTLISNSKEQTDPLLEDVEEIKNSLEANYSIFSGDEGDYTALTQEQKDAYLLAIVVPFARPTENMLQVIEDTILDEEQTVTVVDLTDEEFEAEVDEIIGGV